MKTYRLAVLAAAVIWLLTIIAVDLSTCRYRLGEAGDAVQQEEQYDRSDNQENRYQIFFADTEGVVQGRIVSPKPEGEWRGCRKTGAILAVMLVGFAVLAAGISRVWNRMSRELKERMEYVRECSVRYASFVPEKVFEILEREDITQVELGDQREIDAAILQVGSRQFSMMAKSLTGDRLYGMINRLLQEMIPVVLSRGGVIEHMSGDHLTAYYPQECEQALMTAISICEKGNWMSEQAEPVPLYRMVLHYGAIRVGIIGQAERMAAATISEAMTFSSFLQETGEKYGLRILVTESAARQIPDFPVRFRVRQVGYIHLRFTKSLEAVYDVYDGEEAEMARAKEKTRELFTQALGNYLAQNFYEARLKFAQVLRQNPGDMVARAYIYRCDACYRSGDDQGMVLWLEEY